MYGYRPNKNAHQAVASCQQGCRDKAWVLDMDIKGFFDNLSHELLLGMLSEHTSEKWVLMYVERWLKAGVEQADGSIVGRTKGTPQGGVISPLLANLYLHHALDTWLQTHYPKVTFERYADDAVIHCASEEEAKGLRVALEQRLSEYALELHPTKTKIVFCKDYRRNGKCEHQSFTFLGFSFQPKMVKSKMTGMFLGFKAVISQDSKQNIRTSIKGVIRHRNLKMDIEQFAVKLNSKVRGWINYYCQVEPWGLSDELRYSDVLLVKWIQNKYRIRGKRAAIKKLLAIYTERPTLFDHWKFGIRT